MADNELDLLSRDEPISRAKSLGSTIFIFLKPEDKSVDTIINVGIFGEYEYDPEDHSWVRLVPEEDNVRIAKLFSDAIQYRADWSNEDSFDKDKKFIGLSLYSDGKLDQAWLDDNAILAYDPTVTNTTTEE